jgi:hypothetical protein
VDLHGDYLTGYRRWQLSSVLCAAPEFPASITKEPLIMTDAARVAQAYLQTWNEVDGERRRSVLAEHRTDDASYVDPMMRGEGPAQIDALVAAVHRRLPGFRFKLTATPDGHGEYARLSLSLGPDGASAPIEGSDVVQLHRGQIRSVIGFIDRAPAAA